MLKNLYVNEFEPSSTGIGNTRMKTPFRFKFKVIAAFNGLYDSNNYHHIRLSYYTHQSINQKSQNLYYYIPTYHLNGKTMKIIPFPLEKYL